MCYLSMKPLVRWPTKWQQMIPRTEYSTKITECFVAKITVIYWVKIPCLGHLLWTVLENRKRTFSGRKTNYQPLDLNLAIFSGQVFRISSSGWLHFRSTSVSDFGVWICIVTGLPHTVGGNKRPSMTKKAVPRGRIYPSKQQDLCCLPRSATHPRVAHRHHHQPMGTDCDGVDYESLATSCY